MLPATTRSQVCRHISYTYTTASFLPIRTLIHRQRRRHRRTHISMHTEPEAVSSSATCPVWLCPVSSSPSVLSCLLSPAVSALCNGGIVAIPTETVYGLAGDARSDAAIELIYSAKGRPNDNPLIVHCDSLDAVMSLTLPLSKSELQLANIFWPGPLTMILTPATQTTFSSLVTCGLKTVAMRVPSHPVAHALLSALNGIPLAAPSANLSGKPSPTTAEHVIRDLGQGRGLSGIIDSGHTNVGLESTVVRCEGENVTILRPGGITREMIQHSLPQTTVNCLHTHTHNSSSTSTTSNTTTMEDYDSPMITPIAPGMKYTHYAPDAPLTLLLGDTQWIQQMIMRQVKQNTQRVGVLTFTEDAASWQTTMQALSHDECQRVLLLSCGSQQDLPSVARSLFACLRQFDQQGVDSIFVPVLQDEEQGLAQAIMNRLYKAAGGKIWKQKDPK